jgi:elongation factor G
VASVDVAIVDPHNSDTYKEVARDKFDISYVDSSYSSGDYFEDRFEIGGVVVQKLTMGLGTQTNIPYGLVGVGYTANEASLSTMGRVYPNLPVAMQREGLINSIAYSLWLNDLGANAGNILFGGVDTEKYIGPLTKVDVIPRELQDNYAHFLVSLTSLEATSPSGTDVLTSPKAPLNVVLDSGTTLTYLPNDIASRVWEEVGAEYQDLFGMAVLPCSHGLHPGHFSFGFAGSRGPRINVTMDELVVDLTNGEPPTFASGPYEGELVCEFGIQNYSTGPYVLGDTFLRSAYIVYDLENHDIAIAATDFNSTGTKIVPFRSKGAPIPSATTAGEHEETAVPPLATTSTLIAAEGFQNGDELDDGAMAVRKFPLSAMVTIAISFVLVST